MKLSEALTALAAVKTELSKASAEILAKIASLQNSDPDISPEGADTVNGLITIAKALDDVVPDETPAPEAPAA